MDKDPVDRVVDVARRVVASGAIYPDGHADVSLCVPGAEEACFTGGHGTRDGAGGHGTRHGPM